MSWAYLEKMNQKVLRNNNLINKDLQKQAQQNESRRKISKEITSRIRNK